MTTASDTLETPKIEPPKQRIGVSPIWLVPLAAVLIALFAAWQNYADQGPLITVTFENAAGVHADETDLRHRDITVGVVEGVRFTDGLSRVAVDIRLNPAIAPYVDSESRFWVVRPQVTTQGVSGLDTVLSGVYIQGVWDGEQGLAASEFEGFEAAPLLRAGETGTAIRIIAPDRLPAAETPILYKGVTVGRLAAPELSPGGLQVEAEGVIFAPYDDLITDRTRFWSVSGFSFEIGPDGAGVDFSSLAALIGGGITFETFSPGGIPLREGDRFTLHADEETARDDFFVTGAGTTVNLIAIFDDNLPGLRPGAAVELGGLKIGEVAALTGLVDPLRFGDGDARLVATLRLSPARIGLGQEAGAQELIDFLDRRVAEGTRAQLRSAGILPGTLKIALVSAPQEPPSGIDRAAQPFPEIPTTASDVADFASTANGLLSRVDALPVEELMASAVGLMTDARRFIGADGTQALPAQISALAAELVAAAERVESVLEDIDEAGGGTAIARTLDNVADTTEALPALIARTQGLVDGFAELPIDTLLDEATALTRQADSLLEDPALAGLAADVQTAIATLDETVQTVNRLIAAEATQALPGQIAALMQDTTTAVRRIDTMLAALEEAETATALAASVSNVNAASAALPDLVADTRTLVANLDTLPVDALIADARTLAGRIDALLVDPATQALPAEATRTLERLSSVLASVQEITDDAALRALPAQVSDLTGTLTASADTLDGILTAFDDAGTAEALTRAIQDVTEAADALPQIADRAEAVLALAEDLPLEALATEATALLTTAEALLAQPGTQALPETAVDALETVRSMVADLQAGGAVENTNDALAAARDAATTIAEAAETLPALAERLAATAETAQQTLEALGTGSSFLRDAQGAVRQIDAAAQAVQALARQIQRNPSSLITGR